MGLGPADTPEELGASDIGGVSSLVQLGQFNALSLDLGGQGCGSAAQVTLWPGRAAGRVGATGARHGRRG